MVSDVNKCLFLVAVSSVVDFTEKIFFFIIFSKLLKPESQDSPVDNEKDTKETNIINTKPFAGTVSGNSSAGRKNDRHDSSNTSNNSSLNLRHLHGHGERSRLAGNAKGCRLERRNMC
jgi:hypothetical protein